MKNIDEIRKIFKENKDEVQKKFYVKELGIFGSYVKGQQGEGSDIDILVEFFRPVGFFAFLDLEEHLSQLLGIEVDLVSKKALKPRIGMRILEESVSL